MKYLRLTLGQQTMKHGSSLNSTRLSSVVRALPTTTHTMFISSAVKCANMALASFFSCHKILHIVHPLTDAYEKRNRRRGLEREKNSGFSLTRNPEDQIEGKTKVAAPLARFSRIQPHLTLPHLALVRDPVCNARRSYCRLTGCTRWDGTWHQYSVQHRQCGSEDGLEFRRNPTPQTRSQSLKLLDPLIRAWLCCRYIVCIITNR